MKMRAAKAVHYDSGPNMTPLVDVVMVILIFLMLAGSFGSSEHFMASKTPIHSQGAGGQPPPPGWHQPNQLNVKIYPDGDYSLQGVANAGDRGAQRLTRPEDLTALLLERVKEYGSKEDVEVILKPDGLTRWESLAPLYDAALRANIDKIAFAMTGSK